MSWSKFKQSNLFLPFVVGSIVSGVIGVGQTMIYVSGFADWTSPSTINTLASYGKAYPELYSRIDGVLADNKITRREYEDVMEVAEDVDEQRLIRKTREDIKPEGLK